jgi:putative ABC transport system substrate-binding protein
MIRRREFITLLGGVAAAWPLAARAQQEGMRWSGSSTPESPKIESGSRIIAFRQGLNKSGYVEG